MINIAFWRYKFAQRGPDFAQSIIASQDKRAFGVERSPRCTPTSRQVIRCAIPVPTSPPDDVDPGSVPSIDFSQVVVSRIEKDSHPGLVRVVLASCGSNGHANNHCSRLMLSMTQGLFLAF